MNLTEDEIFSIIKKYIDNEKTKYAIMLNGKWGTGKTYFVKNKILNNEKCIYISLYGISSVEEINNKIFYSYIEKNTNVDEKMLKNIQKIIKCYSTFVAPLSKKARNLIDGIDFTNLIGSYLDLSNYVIIFDDLERVNLPINEVLGFINNYVEHKNVKSIIITNEDEIRRINLDNNYELKMISSMNQIVKYDSEKNEEKVNIDEIKRRVEQTYDVENKYKVIKEKLVGVTIDYIPDLEQVFDKLICNYSDENDYYSCLKKNKEKICSLFVSDNCYNIRTFDYFLSSFYEVFSNYKIIKFKRKNEKLLKLMMVNTIHMSVLLKNGIDIKKIMKGTKYCYTTFDEKNSFDLSKHYVAFDFICDFLCSANLNKKKMKDTLKQYSEIESEKVLSKYDPFVKLEAYWELEDYEIEKYLKQMIENFNYYPNIFSRIIGIISGIENMGLFPNLTNKVINKMESYIENNDCEYIDFNTFINDPNVSEIYEKHINYFKTIIALNKKKNNSNSLYSALLSDKWGEELYKLFANKNIIYEYGLFSLLDISLIIENIKYYGTKQIFYLKYTIDNVYRFEHLSKYYSFDEQNFENLYNSLLNLDKTDFNKTKILAVDSLVKTIENKMKYFKT